MADIHSARWPSFSFFGDTATTEIYTLSLHDALPISSGGGSSSQPRSRAWRHPLPLRPKSPCSPTRSEEHTSELQSRGHLVCRLLLEKKKDQRFETCGHTAAFVPCVALSHGSAHAYGS